MRLYTRERLFVLIFKAPGEIKTRKMSRKEREDNKKCFNLCLRLSRTRDLPSSKRPAVFDYHFKANVMAR